MFVCLIGLGGCMGAILRYWIGQRLNTGAFPWGTLVVNLIGAFVLGWLITVFATEKWLAVWGGGLLGALTTFSTIQIELLEMIKQRAWKKCIFYLAATYILGIMLGLFGFYLG